MENALFSSMFSCTSSKWQFSIGCVKVPEMVLGGPGEEPSLLVSTNTDGEPPWFP